MKYKIGKVLQTSGSDVALCIDQNLGVILSEAGFPERPLDGLLYRTETGSGKRQ